jgi:DNA-binding TFAR19-related protein (PDSD5 family)
VQEALPVAEKMPEGDEQFTANGLLARAQALQAQERGDAAAEARAGEAFEQAARSLLAAEARWRLSQLLLLRADQELSAGRFDAAAAIAERIRGLGKESTVQMRHGRAHVVIAEIALARGDRAAAREQLALALTAPGSIGARLRARISAAAALAGFSEGARHAEIRGGT